MPAYIHFDKGMETNTVCISVACASGSERKTSIEATVQPSINGIVMETFIPRLHNDPNGNTLTGGGRTNTWDCENRLIQCTKGLNTSTFTYGSDGLRRSRTVTNSGTSDTTYYALDGQSVVREMKRNSQNQLVNKATYLTGASGPVYRRDDVTGTYKWYVYDGLGSVVSEVDDSGNPERTNRF